MPRYRKLYVKTTESLDINDMPDDFTRLMWVLMPLGLCQEGRGIDNAAWIKSKLFPLRIDVTQEMISTAMDWYEQRGMVRRYQINGRPYFCVPTFRTYQGDTSREADTNYPPPPEESAPHSRPTHDPLTTNSSSYTDANANTDPDANTDAEASSADAPSSPGPTPAELVFLEQIGAFEDEQDRKDVLAMEVQVGSVKVAEAIKWARRKHVKGNDLIQSICTAASKWIMPTGPPSDNGRGDRSSNATLDAIAELEAEVNGGFG